MRYTLATNAFSSLSIAIEHFKKIYYHKEELTPSLLDESTKICVVFLENSIELLLKTILVSGDPLAIYKQPSCEAIKKAQSELEPGQKLEDYLISRGNLKTINYTEAVKEYNKIYHKSEKLCCVLKKLGEARNNITHFGIDDDWNEFIIQLINVFDIIYNYLYRQLIELDEIGDFFVSEGLMVDTIHGQKPLFDKDYIYNSIVDFLDELLEESKEYICKVRAKDPRSNISCLSELMKTVLSDKEFQRIQAENNSEIDTSGCSCEENDYYFEVKKEGRFIDNILSVYSPFFNVTAFVGETGCVYFVVDHNNNKIYFYHDSFSWPDCSEPEPDYHWESDIEKGHCSSYNLSKRNILKVFETLLA